MKIKLADGSGTADLKYLHSDKDRHDNTRLYFRRKVGAAKIRMTAAPGTEEFLEDYRLALRGERRSRTVSEKAVPAKSVDPASFELLATRYMASSAFLTLDPETQYAWRRTLEAICAEKIDGVRTGPLPYALMEPKHVKIIQEAKAKFPEAANQRVKVMRQMFKWACDPTVALAKGNPARDVKYINTASQGFHTWSVDEVYAYQNRHPVGTKARLAMDLMLMLMVRRSDVVLLGPQMECDGGAAIAWTEFKGRKKKPKARILPILPALRASIDATKSGHLAYLTTKYGKPFTRNGFGNWFKRRCREAGLEHCSAHGLRKAGATFAAEHGATTKQLQALGGWKTLKEPERYTQAANMKTMAASAMHMVVPTENPAKNPHPNFEAKSGENSGRKSLGIKARRK